MIVYGSSLSPFVRKALLFAAEKGIEVENKPVAPGTYEPDFLEASPFKKMPALRDGDFTVADSSAIIHYLEAVQPEPALIPTEPKARATTIWFEEFADTILCSCGAKMFFNRVVAPLIGRQGDLAVADAAERDELPPILDYLERVVPDGEGFLVGDGITLADIAVAGPFVNFMHLSLAQDRSRHPRTYTYMDRIHARPAFARSIERESRFLSRVAA